MISPTLEYLIARLDDLEDVSSAEFAKTWVNDELLRLTRDAFVHVGSVIKVTEIAGRHRHRQSLDLNALVGGIAALRRELSGQGQPSTNASIQIDPGALLNELDQDIDRLRASKDDSTSTLRRAMLVSRMDWKFMRVVVYLLARNQVPFSLRDLILGKISSLRDPQVALFWSWVSQELRGEGGLSEGSAPPAGFENFDDPESARGKIANYIAIEKPRLILIRSQRGLTNYPLEVPGITQALSGTSTEDSERLPVDEETVVQSLIQVTALARSLFDLRREELALDLQLTDVDFLRGSGIVVQDAKQTATDSQLRFQLRTLIRATDQLVTRDSSLSRSLRQYKLGIEILVTKLASSYKKKLETLLQKDLCKFLVERNIFAVGTKFGPHETDLVVNEGGVQYVIEVKKIGKAPTLSMIEGPLAQLLSYLDDHLVSVPYGILVLYNFTDCGITAPLERIRGRIQIVVINLHAKPASRRTRSVVIEPGDNGKLIKLVETAAVGRKAKQARKEMKKARK